MLEYKVCFHMSFHQSYRIDRRDNSLQLPSKSHGKMHFCGSSLEEAVAKVRDHVAHMEVNGRGTCTSMWIMRGRDKGKNIKWADYHKPKDKRNLWHEVLRVHAMYKQVHDNRIYDLLRERRV